MKLLSDVLHIIANISWAADIAGMLICIVLGMVWYSSFFFGTTWRQLTGVTKESTESVKANNNMIWHIPIAFLIAANISAFCKHFGYNTAAQGGLIGYDLGLITCLFLAILYLYEQRPLALYGINAGYIIISTSLMGLAIGILV